MAKLDHKELKKKNHSELAKLLTDKEKSLHDFRFGIAGSKVKNVKEGKDIKRDIARIKTAMKQIVATK